MGLVGSLGHDLLAYMARTTRRSAVATGQLGNEFRNRVSSGFQSVHLEPLRRLIDEIGHPVYAFGRTSAALHSLDGFGLKPPFQLVVPRGRNVVRLGHVVHTSVDLDPIDCEERHGIPVLSSGRLADPCRLPLPRNAGGGRSARLSMASHHRADVDRC